MLFLGMFLISLASALSCDQSFFTETYQEDNLPTDYFKISRCDNSGGNLTQITLSGAGAQYIELEETSIGNAIKDIRIKPKSNIVIGNHPFSLSFGGQPLVSGIITVEGSQSTPTGCIIDIFPTILSNVKIKQGEQKTRNVQLTIPSCYPNSVIVQGVILQADERPITLGELTLGTMQPGSSVIIPLEINAIEDVSTGVYQDSLLFSIFNSSGEKINLPSVSISATVTSGINPGDGSFSLSDLPTCSLSAIELNLNNSYKLTCSNIDINIDVKPIVDHKYIHGIGVSEESGQYVYEFKAMNIGTTIISTEFLFKNAPIGSLFEQEVRISASGASQIAGTDLKAEFWQGDSKKTFNNLFPGLTKIKVIDNKTSSLITNSEIYINGDKINGTITLESDKSYEIRITAFGYIDYVNSFNVSEKSITYTLTPSSGITVDTQINLTVEANASIFIDGIKKGEGVYIGTLTQGEKEVELIHKDYQNTKFNISVEGSIYIQSGYSIDDFKRGVEQIFTLNKNASWSVYYQKDSTAQTELKHSGVGNKITFKPNKKGIWTIEADSKQIFNQEIKRRSIPGWNWIKNHKWYSLIAVIILGGIGGFFYYRKRGGKSVSSSLMFTPPAEE